MTRALYFDCFAGASGDMIIGALIDSGLAVPDLTAQLARLGLDGYEVSAGGVKRCGISATKFDVTLKSSIQPARRIQDIRDMILGSQLSEFVKKNSLRVFERLGEAEARVHGVPIDEVHFHEVGAVDSIIDIVGTMAGLEALGIPECFASALRVGFGTVKTEHGVLPVPAPATADLLRGAPVFAGDVEGEFVTPTGAAIITTLCTFRQLPPMTIDHIGYGAGSRDPEHLPNVLRLISGETEVEHEGRRRAAATSSGAAPHQVAVIETNIDDMNPQAYSFVFDRAFALGALDVYLTPVQMKKDRPAVLVTVLARPDAVDEIADMLLAETTTLGVRFHGAERRVLERSVEFVDTQYGPVRIKVARDGARTLHFQPEYDDCARVAKLLGVPLVEVQAAASARYRETQMARNKEVRSGEEA